MTARFRRLQTLLLLALFAGLISSPALSQGGPHKGPGLLDEIRRALSFRPAAEIWEQAVRTPSTAEALPLMTALLSRASDPNSAAKAALWLGHYQYGLGHWEDALGYFELSLQRGGEGGVREEADFWAAHCRNLLGRPAETPRAAVSGFYQVLIGLASHDAELRSGDVANAWKGYLALEGDARQSACVGPLLYRMALIASIDADQIPGGDDAWDLIRRWEPAAAESPEMALVRNMQPKAVPPRASPAEESVAASDSAFSPPEPQGAEPQGEEPQGAEPPPEASAGSRPSEPIPPSRAEVANYSVQLGAFLDGERAARELQRILSLGLAARMDQDEMGGRIYYKIRLGRLSSRGEAEELARRQCQGLEWQVVRLAP